MTAPLAPPTPPLGPRVEATFRQLTPLVLLVSLFTKDKRLLHDIVLGIVFVNRY